MDILLSNSSNMPLYEQIFQQIHQQIIIGQLPPGTLLPSIRNLAKELKVSIITTKRAYEELESLGVIDTVVGKGTFVTSEPMGQLKEAAIMHLEEKISLIIQQAKGIGLTREELLLLFDTIYQEDSL